MNLFSKYILGGLNLFKGFPGSSDGKESTCNVGGPGFDPCVGKIPWRRQWLPTPVFLFGEFHGQRSLVGYSPWSCKESDTTERLSTLSKSCTSYTVWFSRITQVGQAP